MNMEGFAVNMQFLWKLDKSSSAEKIDRAGTGALLTLGPEEKMGRLGEAAGRPRLELGLGRLAREARPRRSLGLVNASGLERFDAKQGRQQARLGLQRGRGRAAAPWNLRETAKSKGIRPDPRRSDRIRAAAEAVASSLLQRNRGAAR